MRRQPVNAPAKRERGVNPKRWFYRFQEVLEARPDHARLILAGSAAEQWLNAEFTACIAEELDRDGDLYAYAEWLKHDVGIFRDDEHEAAVALVEIKLIYRSYSEQKVVQYLSKLQMQMRRAREQKCHVVGVVLGVWAEWPTNRSDGMARWSEKRTRRSFVEFRETLGSAAREIFGDQMARPTMETLLDAGTVRNGSVHDIQAGLVGQYVRM